MTRAATGYGYRTISHWCQAAARALVETDRCRPFAAAPIVCRMDALFLTLLEQRPDVMPTVLIKLAKKHERRRLRRLYDADAAQGTRPA